MSRSKNDPDKARQARIRHRNLNPDYQAKKSREYRKRNPDHSRDQMYRLKYGIGLDGYKDLYDEQDGLCAICRNHYDRLQVDHDHETGAIRGLLCGSCNKAIGLLGDDVDRIASAMDYLECHYIDRRMLSYREEMMMRGGG